MRLAIFLLALSVGQPGLANGQSGRQNQERASPDRVPASGSASLEPGTVEVDPIECWWRTSATAVRVGETFTVVLTCSLLNTEAASVVADETRLEPSVVQLPPFEVVGGAHAKDITTAARRFFQYSYDLRVIAENVFASAVSLPALEVAYKIESRADLGASVAGRDQSYALPTLAVRVLSIVPDTATDIREAPVATFAEVEDAGFRGVAMQVGGWVLVVLGALLLVLALAGVLRRRVADVPQTRYLSDTVVLQGVRRELVSIQEQSRGGWTADLAGRALAALRVVVAHAAGRPVMQQVQERGGRSTGASRSATTPAVADPKAVSAGAGQLAIDGPFGRSAIVSASVTSVQADDELRDAMARFAAARYGRDTTFDERLDDGLEAGIRVADRLIASRPRLERLWAR
jgi:hypothetical protein